MGSVIDYISCPNCGTEAFSDFYYKTGEEIISCNNCGYLSSATIKNRDKNFTELTNEDWEFVEIKNPYGAFRYKLTGEQFTTCGTLATEEDADEFIIKMERNENGVIEYAAISRLVDGEIKVTDLIG